MGDFRAPLPGEFEGNLAARLLPEQDMSGARGQPEVSFGAVESGAEVLLAGIEQALRVEGAFFPQNQAVDFRSGGSGFAMIEQPHCFRPAAEGDEIRGRDDFQLG